MAKTAPEEVTEEDKIVNAIRHALADNGGFQLFDADQYTGFGLLWNGKPYLVTVNYTILSEV